MKRLFALLLALFLLTGCAGPGLREGYYLASLEKSDGMPVYFCLEPGGDGYLHAMGQDLPVSWTAEGLAGDFSDGMPTREGLEFPGADGPLVLTWQQELPEAYQNDRPPEYYLATMED